MQKRKFDELISHFNREVSDMGIDQKYKMELLGMISAIGFAHEKELSTNLAEVGTSCSEFPNNSDTISRQAAIDALNEYFSRIGKLKRRGLTKGEKAISLDTVGAINSLPSAEPQIVRCKDCKHHWTHKCMDSMPIERCDLEQTFYDAEHDFCSFAERREVTT